MKGTKLFTVKTCFNFWWDSGSKVQPANCLLLLCCCILKNVHRADARGDKHTKLFIIYIETYFHLKPKNRSDPDPCRADYYWKWSWIGFTTHLFVLTVGLSAAPSGSHRHWLSMFQRQQQHMVAEHAAKNDPSTLPALPLLSPAVPLSSRGCSVVNTEKETRSFRTRSTTVPQLWYQAACVTELSIFLLLTWADILSASLPASLVGYMLVHTCIYTAIKMCDPPGCFGGSPYVLGSSQENEVMAGPL